MGYRHKARAVNCGLIPKAWLGITDRRRPDFVAFVPLQYWKYRWLAIQLDGAHPEESAEADAARDNYVRSQNYNAWFLWGGQFGRKSGSM